jgi:phage baseplate assembly protein W
MATVTYTRRYSDLDLNFNIHPVRKDITKHVDERAVINSIKNLLSTNHYERPFRPFLGGNIRRLLFENLDSITATRMEKEVEQIIRNFEPRAILEKVTVLAKPESNSFGVTIEFSIVNRQEPITITFQLERIR